MKSILISKPGTDLKNNIILYPGNMTVSVIISTYYWSRRDA